MRRSHAGPMRRTLRMLGLGAASLGLVACGDGDATSSGSTTSSKTTTTTSSTTSSSAAAVPTEEIPEETSGPYPGDGSNGPDVLEQSGIVRADIRSSFGDASGTAEGVPMTLELSIYNLADSSAPYEGVAVYVWHCTREGEYSLYSQNITNENYLRGVQVADAAGKVTCDEVYTQDGYEASVNNLSQVSLATDNVFGNDSAAHQLATVTGDATSGYTVSLSVGVK